jgi:hypothetical protein
LLWIDGSAYSFPWMALVICESALAASLAVAPAGCTFEQPSIKPKVTVKTVAAT